jgi:Uma2 family endonuclease
MATQPLWGADYNLGDIPPDDLVVLGGEGVASELWEGRLIQEEMTYPKHAIVANRIGYYFLGHLLSQQIQADVAQHMLFNLTQLNQPRTVLAPDVAILPVGFVAQPHSIPTIAPWLAVEILSPSQTMSQMRLKAPAYLSSGSGEIWIVDPEQKLIEVSTSSTTTTYRGQQVIVSTILPGFPQTVDILLV